MNSTMILKKVALFTLLVSAVAMPTYIANAATGPMVDRYVASMKSTNSSPFATVQSVTVQLPGQP
ncbi:hypothetical protein [Cohnella abietis]|uniref:Uncharacterized protein n=1 Tax=Cohnella abietis TaxID=2507935 RepID=A0A3T1D5A5_9BACL|nr:hypothetical protein [Cohnella abietis]BBI33284.1 hypothetical protein KCTCHS21_26830 [Cohnella abietis]